MVNSEKEPAKRTESGNLYHKQMKPNRSRREPVHKLDSGVVLSSPQKATDNPARQSFIDSIKRFVFFSLAMIILLFLAIKGLRMIWAIRDSKMMSYPPPPPKESVERPVPVVNNRPTGNRPDATTVTTDKESLDTEAIRKAVFLAKRGEGAGGTRPAHPGHSALPGRPGRLALPHPGLGPVGPPVLADQGLQQGPGRPAESG
jgi:hypothetical protein